MKWSIKNDILQHVWTFSEWNKTKMFEINSCAGHAYACAITCF